MTVTPSTIYHPERTGDMSVFDIKVKKSLKKCLERKCWRGALDTGVEDGNTNGSYILDYSMIDTQKGNNFTVIL